MTKEQDELNKEITLKYSELLDLMCHCVALGQLCRASKPIDVVECFIRCMKNKKA